MHQQARADELGRVELFAGCNTRQLKQLARQSHVEHIEPGQALVTQGSPSPQLYVILAGRGHIRRDGAVVDHIAAGDIVGELGLLTDEARNADVVADSALEVLSLDRRGLQRALGEVPGLGWALLTTVAGRLQRAQTR